MWQIPVSWNEVEGECKDYIHLPLPLRDPPQASRCAPHQGPAPQSEALDQHVGCFLRKTGSVFRAASWAVPWNWQSAKNTSDCQSLMGPKNATLSSLTPSSRALGCSCKKWVTRRKNQGTRRENPAPDVKTGAPDCKISPQGDNWRCGARQRKSEKMVLFRKNEKMVPSGFSKARGKHKDMAPTSQRVKMAPTEKKIYRLKQNKNKFYQDCWSSSTILYGRRVTIGLDLSYVYVVTSDRKSGTG